MLCDKGGSIINISSGASKMPLSSTSLYSVSNAASDALTVYYSKELVAKEHSDQFDFAWRY